MPPNPLSPSLWLRWHLSVWRPFLQHFSSLNLCKPLLDALEKQSYDTPTPIQAQAIPPALEGCDVLGCAQTGTGKTAAFALPILHRLHVSRPDKSRRGPIKPRALILSPTRELAGQIDESFGVYGRFTSLRHTVIFGGVKQFHQVRKIRNGVHILTATPGRLLDLVEQRLVDLRKIEVFVLDEADRMLDMGFIHPIREIASLLPVDRQTMLFSATMPRSIMHLADSLLNDPVKVAVTPVASAAPLIDQSIYMVPKAHKRALMEHLLEDADIERALIFTKTKHGADKLTQKLNRAGISTEAIHGNKPQNKRQKALEAFRSGRARVLVATDVAARGLDVDGISHVFNFDLPHEPESYVHRIGRTGRAGATGMAISFCDRSERGQLRAIERLIDQHIETTKLPEELNIEDEPDLRTAPRPRRRASSRSSNHPRPQRSEKRTSEYRADKSSKPGKRTRKNARKVNAGQSGFASKTGRKTDSRASRKKARTSRGN